MLVLDTSILIDIEHNNKKVLSFLQDIYRDHPSYPAITFATFSEFAFGALKQKKSWTAILTELNKYQVLNSDTKSSILTAQLKYQLEAKGKIIDDFDILIAATVMVYKGTLITRDAHFNNIKELSKIIIKN